MSENIDNRLEELGINLPTPAQSVANYVPFVLTGNLVHISGQIPILNGDLKYVGKIGAELTLDDGYSAARLCGLNLIAQARAAAGGDLNRVSQVVKIGGFVNSNPEFIDQPKIINGASDLMVEVFDDKGQHARFAVSSSSLPLGVAVEIDGIFELK